jgi:hypothetical protein
MNHPVARWILTLFAAVLPALAWAEGPSPREHDRYTHLADREVEKILRGKADDVQWQIDLHLIFPDEASRYINPSYPDNSPAPRDDEAAARLMRKVDGKPGGALWAQTGEPSPVEAGSWKQFLPKDGQGQILLSRQNAVKLALLHSRRYQSAREELYLAALDVTEERFRFRDRLTLGGLAENRRLARDRPGLEDSLSVDSDLTLRRSFATGTELITSLANSVLIDLSANANATVSSLIDVSIVQPLLRFRAREYILENLTQSERSLLGNVRRMKQYQQAFYIFTTAGVNLNDGPVRNERGNTTAPIAANPPSNSFSAGGFIGLLQRRQQIRNSEDSVAALQDSLAQLQAAFDAGRISNRLQVDQARQAVYSGQSSLLTSYAAFDSAMDAYKVSLGLPPELPMRLEDDLLEQFDLIDPTMSGLQAKVTNVLSAVRDPSVIADETSMMAALSKLRGTGQEVMTQVARARMDLQHLETALPHRVEQLNSLRKRPELDNVHIDPALFDPKVLDGLHDRRAAELEVLAKQLESAEHNLEATASVPVPVGQLDRARDMTTGALTAISGHLLQLSLIQAAARLESITLPPLAMDYDTALNLAKANRLDWMNARAALVDAWRGIAVEGEALKTGLDLIVRGEIPTVGNQTFAYTAERGVLRLGLQLDSPFRRLVERNNYREALLNYEQARRRYMLFEDQAGQSLRNTLRIVRLNQINFEVKRAAVRVAIAQVELARLRLNEPPKPGVVGAQFGATTARDLVSAVGDLLDAQNDFLNVWVGYDVVRMLLDYELGTMRLDENGVWVDPGTFGPAHLNGENRSGDAESGKVGAKPDVKETRPDGAVAPKQGPPSRRAAVWQPGPLRR